MSEEFKFNISTTSDDRKGKGGTELVYDRVVSRLPKEVLDEFLIIPHRVRDEHFESKKKRILWLHDLPEDPESAHLKFPDSRALFSKFVFPSNWAMWDFHQKLGIPFEDSIVIPNCIEPIAQHQKPDTEKKKIIYFSTPHRGLNILESVVRFMEQQRDDFEVDVYSSFKLYGRDEQDEHPEFVDLYSRLTELKSVNYYGTVSNDQIRDALKETHILSYPSTYLETSCLVTIEAMAAGCLAVVPNYGALPETCKDFARMYQWSPNPDQHAASHYGYLSHALDTFWEDSVQGILDLQSVYFNYFYNMDMCISKWINVLRAIE